MKESTRGRMYFDILFKSTSTLNWLFLTIIIFAGVNFFVLYTWHFGNLKYAIEREEVNLKKIDTLFFNKYGFYKNDSINILKIHLDTNENRFNRLHITAIKDVKNKNKVVSVVDFYSTRNYSELKRMVDTLDSKSNKDSLLSYINNIQNESKKIDTITKTFDALKAETQGYIDSYNKMRNEDWYPTLPFIGISFYIVDYVIVLLIIGCIFLYWYHRVLRFNRDVIKSYFNSPDSLIEEESDSISSLYFFILSSSTKFNRYKQIELGLNLYKISVILILVSDIYEVCYMHHYNMPLYKQPGYFVMLWNIIPTLLIICSTIFFIIRIQKDAKTYLMDLRNLIILTKWTRTALSPAFFYLFKEEKGVELKKGENLTQYKKPFDTEGLHLCFTFVDVKDREYTIKAAVNFSESLKKYNNHQEANAFDNKYLNDFLKSHFGRRPTDDESYMTGFFIKTFTDKSYEVDLKNQWDNCRPA